MERLHNGFTLQLCDGSFPLSTDSIALAAFAKLPKQAKVLDLGAGCATLGMLLCAQYDDCHITGIEIDKNAHTAALQNALDNKVDCRYESICADMHDIASLVKAGSFDICISNPPYFSGGFQHKQYSTARQETACTTESVFSAAAWALRYGGDFYLVHRPERLAELCALGAKYTLEPKRLLLLRHREDGPVSLILLQCRKGGKPGLIWEEASLHTKSGDPTAYYRKLYHL